MWRCSRLPNLGRFLDSDSTQPQCCSPRDALKTPFLQNFAKYRVRFAVGHATYRIGTHPAQFETASGTTNLASGLGGV
jgi:hypothetical protein